MNWISRRSPLRAISKDGSRCVTDEFYNTWIAIIGMVLAIVGTSYLLDAALAAHKPWHVLGYALYAFGAISLFLMSILHHGIDASHETEELFRHMDYCAIFLMIAGTQSPFCLILMRNAWGWSIFGIEWALAILGILLKLGFPRVPKKVTTSIYLLMGWMGLFLLPAMYTQGGIVPVLLLIAGGLLYTVGSLIFQLERPNPWPGKFGFHEIWHSMVVLAFACQMAVMVYLLRL